MDVSCVKQKFDYSENDTLWGAVNNDDKNMSFSKQSDTDLNSCVGMGSRKEVQVIS